MADIQIDWINNQTQLIKGLDEQIQKTGEFDAALKKAQQTQAEAARASENAVNSVTKAVEKEVKAAADAEKQNRASKKSQDNLNKSILNSVKNYKILGVSINDVQAGLTAKITSLKAARGAIVTTNGALKLFRTALLSTGIGALVVALGSLVSFLSNTQKGLDLVSKAGAVVNSIFGNLTDVASRVGEGLFNIFRGNFSQGFDQIANSANGLGDELIRDANAALELESRTQALRDSQRELNLEFAKTKAAIEENRFAAEDESKSFQERQAALERANKLETDLEEKRLKLAKDNLEIIRGKNALSESLADDLDAEAEAEAALFQIQQQSDQARRRFLTRQQGLQRELNAQIKAQREELIKLNAEYQKFVDDVQGKIQSLELEQLGGEELIQRQRELALAEVAVLEEQARKASEAIGKEFDLTDEFDNLRALVDRKFNEESIRLAIKPIIEEGEIELPGALSGGTVTRTIQTNIIGADGEPIEREIDIEISTSLIGAGRDFEALGQEQAEKIAAGISQGVTNNEDTVADSFARLKDKILDSLNITGEEFGQITSALDGLANTFLEGQIENTEAQISAQEKLIERINDGISETERAINRELALAEKGKANNLDVEKEKLESLQAEREAAENKRLEFEKKAAQQRLKLDALQQVSALAVSVANVVAAESKKGLLGIVTAITAITGFIALFSRFKAASAALVQVPELRHGGKLKGPSHEGGGVDIYIKGRRRYNAEGDEWMVNKQDSTEQDQILNEINSGEHRGTNLSEVVRESKELKEVKEVKETQVVNNSNYINLTPPGKGERAPLFNPVIPTVSATVETGRRVSDTEKQVIINKIDRDNKALEKAIQLSSKEIVKAVKEIPLVIQLKDKTIVKKSLPGGGHHTVTYLSE